MNEHSPTRQVTVIAIPWRAKAFSVAPLSFLVATTGCSSTPSATSDARFTHDIVLTMGLTVPAYTELHQCQFATLPNAADVEAISFSHQYTPGSHHFLVISTDLDAVPADMPGQYDCTNGNEPVMIHARGVLYGAQTPTGHFPLPAGVGLRLTAKQVVILQTHYLNTTASPIDARVQFGIDTAAAGSVQQHAGFMFFYDPFIYLPPQRTASSGIRCPVPDAINIISASSHYHQRGTGMSVWIDENGSPSATPFFETHDWQHPADFHGPFAVPAGSTVRFQCTYDNADTTEVFEGPNAKTSEMCVFGGLYYPKGPAAFEACRPMSVIGTGTASCSDLTACFRACSAGSVAGDAGASDGARTCKEKCISAGCQGAADALLSLASCAQQVCGAECATADCDACLLARCPSQVTACSGKACPP